MYKITDWNYRISYEHKMKSYVENIQQKFDDIKIERKLNNL